MFCHEELPIHRIDHRHDGLYVIEVVSRLPRGTLPISSAHSWLRLYNPQGSVISFGFFGDRPIISLWQFIRHLRPRQGKIMLPDVYEAVTSTRDQLVTPIEITEESYQVLVQWLCKVHKSGERMYHVLDTAIGTNCAGFVGEALRLVGIKLGRLHFNMPASVIHWQKTIHRWRERELRQVLNRGRPVPSEIHHATYDLPQAIEK